MQKQIQRQILTQLEMQIQNRKPRCSKLYDTKANTNANTNLKEDTDYRGVQSYQIHQQASSSFTFGKDLIKHNLVVFRSGEGALQVHK